MESPLPENSSSAADLRMAIEGLIRGRKLTRQLKEMMKKPVCANNTEDIVCKIMDSFSEALSVINSSGDFHEVSQVKAVSGSTATCKTSPLKDRRGCYKRRKNSETNIKESSDLVDDGHAWRKYGQKQILNTTHPRNYFRCTHKYDQNCKATKQVQKIQESPPLFRTTYYGRHTCKPVSQLVMDSPTEYGPSSLLLSFDQNVNYVTFSSSVKQEIKDEVTSLYPNLNNDQDDHQNQSSNSNYFLPANDHPAFEESSSHVSPGVYSSCTNSNDNLAIDFDECLWNFDYTT